MTKPHFHLTILSNSSPHFNNTALEVIDTKTEDDEEDQSLMCCPDPPVLTNCLSWKKEASEN